ncbi:MAG TPA: hypothetical protein VI072_34320 [Polyangiaceae bacterium]
MIIAAAALTALVAVPALIAAELALHAAGVAAVFALLLAGFGSMTVTVTDRSIEARLGVGIFKRRVQFEEVRAYRLVKNPWYYGWGIRLFPGGTLYNVSGTAAVELVLANGRRVRFGTDDAEPVLRVLGEVLGPSKALTPGEEQQLRTRGRRFIVASALFGAALVVGLAVWFSFEMRPPRVELSADKLSVSSTMYGVDVPLHEITSVSLRERLPRIRRRTNGFALGHTLRGHFRLDELGDGRLFIVAGQAPYVLVRTRESYVVVNFAEPERTRELYAALKRRVPER